MKHEGKAESNQKLKEAKVAFWSHLCVVRGHWAIFTTFSYSRKLVILFGQGKYRQHSSHITLIVEASNETSQLKWNFHTGRNWSKSMEIVYIFICDTRI